MGIIKECGGKMYMSEKRWDAALDEFNDSFKSLVESGNSQARTMLKYVILAEILSKTEVDHLSTNEAKIYSQDNEIVGMTSLKTAVAKNDINTIQRLLADKNLNILGDPFIKTYL